MILSEDVVAHRDWLLSFVELPEPGAWSIWDVAAALTC